MSVVRVLPISTEHVVGFHAALDSVAREKKYLAWFQAPPVGSTREFVKQNIENDIPQFVALDGEKVVGWCDISLNVSRPVFSHVGTLGMGIISEYRGRGIGKELLLTALRKAKDIGLERIELEVYASNKAARALYEKLGFQVEGRKIKSAKIEGRYEDDFIMALFLDQIDP